MRYHHILSSIGLGLTTSLLAGCAPKSPSSAPEPAPVSGSVRTVTNNDPWVLETTDPNRKIDIYLANGEAGLLVGWNGQVQRIFSSNHYLNEQLIPVSDTPALPGTNLERGSYRQSLNLKTGRVLTQYRIQGKQFLAETKALQPDGAPLQDSYFSSLNSLPGSQESLSVWRGKGIEIEGDAEASRFTHASLFYLLSSTHPGSDHSIPPMGLSSQTYNGHIFWDAEVWMLPALLPQYPEYALPLIRYRYNLLPQAIRNAKASGYAGAEFPWESAVSGRETAPAEFAQERHVSSGVAYAAWNYYLWTGDRDFLRSTGWPLLKEVANNWISRAKQGEDGKWHFLGVLSPDETAGKVDDDAYTNGAIEYCLRAARLAAKELGQPIPLLWIQVGDHISFPQDTARRIPSPNTRPLVESYRAKQADTLLLLYPLRKEIDLGTAGRMLDFYAPHTSQYGPAMTSSIHAIVAAGLNRSQQASAFFKEAYRPFIREPWCAFSEKRTTDNVYFLTGMGGCLQSVLYGFAGLRVEPSGQRTEGTVIATKNGVTLTVKPCLPDGWKKLTLSGIRFRGDIYNLTISAGNKVRIQRITGGKGLSRK